MVGKQDSCGVEVLPGPDGPRLRLPASYSAVDGAVDAARRRYAPHAGEEVLFRLLTALREALLNAVTHGSGLDPALCVECGLGLAGKTAVVTVRDPGPGFDTGDIPATPPAPEGTRGRGLVIMKLLSESLTFNETGNEITLTFFLDERGKTMTPPTDTDAPGGVVTPEGDIVASMAEGFRALLTRAARKHPGGLTIDMRAVAMIDSVGMGLLVATHNTLAGTGGQLTLANVREDIVTLLTAMRLHKHFILNPGA